LDDWIRTTSKNLDIEAKTVSFLYPDLDELLLRSGPSLIRLSGDGSPRFLLLLRGTKGKATLIATDLTEHSVDLSALREVLCHDIESPVAASVDSLLDRARVTGAGRNKARAVMVRERLRQARITDCWLLQSPPGSSFWHQARLGGLLDRLVTFSSAHAIDYLLWIFAWYLIGRGALDGRLDWGWLLAWSLVLLTGIPFRMVASWHEGLFVIGVGGLLKQRLLQGALRLEPDELRHMGAGYHLGRVIESEVVESLALSGGVLTLVAVIELTVSTMILASGAGGGPHVLLLGAWLCFVLFIGFRYMRARQRWAASRLGISHELIEKMVGHRTRLAQERPEEWHEVEDQELTRYLGLSTTMDRMGAVLMAMPRGWMVVGLIGLAPAFIAGEANLARLAVGLGGFILAARALVKLVDGFATLADAIIAWGQVRSLFHAAARKGTPGDATASQLASLSFAATDDTQPLLEACDLVYRYPNRGEPVLRGMSFRIQEGDRILLESPSGGGKSTVVSLVNGLRAPSSGLLLLHGLDQRSLGENGWTDRIATAPQFHENHVITETFAFNLLMGRRWPPEPEDMEEAEELCRELGLGDLLDRMPAGMLQMVGETGWQLSHGEKSRLYIARALLQDAELVMLDESFAALDPDTLQQALGCVLDRAPSLLVIAHP
jgi:ATP-binding cassette subfamily B protein